MLGVLRVLDVLGGKRNLLTIFYLGGSPEEGGQPAFGDPSGAEAPAPPAPRHLKHLPPAPRAPEHLQHRVGSWYHPPVQLRLPWSAPKPPAVPRVRTITVEGRTLPIVIARHRWARRYVARVTPGGEVRLTVPRGASIAAGLAFIEREAVWVASEWRRVQQRTRWDHGTQVRYRGEIMLIERDRTTVTVGDVRIRCAADDDPRARLEAHWRTEAARELPARCLELAVERGLRPISVRVRNQRSRWGACSGRGAITLNWRLVQMPPDVADYVMLHELAHLRQPNHSRRFWREVESLCPGWRTAERWLKTFGRDLL